MSGSRCRTCAAFACEIVLGDGEPGESTGLCAYHRKRVDDDDWCNHHKVARWVKVREGGEE